MATLENAVVKNKTDIADLDNKKLNRSSFQNGGRKYDITKDNVMFVLGCGIYEVGANEYCKIVQYNSSSRAFSYIENGASKLCSTNGIFVPDLDS